MSIPAVQKLRAVHLYRQSLKTCLSWAVNRDFWYTELARIRNEFEKHRHEGDAAAVESLLTKGENLLVKYKHPDPYTVPYSYGGSKFARNPPVPADVHVTMDFGREDDTFTPAAHH